jgi:2Fe-2S ferredoxin
MRVATGAGIEAIAADCGGCLSCATCHVYVDEAWLARLPPMSDDESAMLEMTAAERRPHSRLSCEIVLDDSLDGLVVHLPETQY